MKYKIQIRRVKKKLAGGHRFLYSLVLYLIIFFSKNLLALQIYDYQTEKFIDKINSQILNVNSYNKKINFKIINDDFPNAFVTEDNTIYLSSGLLSYSPDYVSLLGVLAHEIGHIENYHVKKRINEINNLKNISSYGNLAVVVGSMIMKQPEIVNAVAVNNTAVNNMYINFSQEQEIEADFYALETINKLKLPAESLKKLLIILEKKSNFDLVDKELIKFSTHPRFEDRYEILNYKKTNVEEKIDKELQKEFNFIKAKFMAYTDNGIIEDLNSDSKIYYESIQFSKQGNLIESLKNINFLISKYDNNLFLIETKADILLSYGFNTEAIQFYKKILKSQPNNNYIRYNIFLNLELAKKDYKFNENFFINNLSLLKYFPSDKNLLIKYYNLSKHLKKKEWILFFEIILFDLKEDNLTLSNLNKQTKDYNLKKIIKLYN